MTGFEILWGATAIAVLLGVVLVATHGVEVLGDRVIQTASGTGRVSTLVAETLQWALRRPPALSVVFSQMMEVGVRSFPVVGLTSLFTGMVVALQTAYSTGKVFSEPFYLGSIVGFSMVKELGPVLTCLVVAGRVGAAITAEIGTMKVTEQIDALYTLGTNPVRYLAVPRFFAAVLMIPVLVIFADFIGIVGGYLVSVYRFATPPTTFVADITDYMKMDDVVHGLLKSVFFAAAIATVACYKGFATTGGAEGVGRATTQTVVTSMVLILISDYFLTALLVAFGIGA